MSDFIELIAADEVPSGGMKEVERDGHVLLVAHIGDAFYITDGKCPHMGGTLAKGVLEGVVVTCPLHRSQFDLSDGHVVRWTDWKGAALSVGELIRHPRPLRTYAVKVDGGMVSVGPENIPPVTPGT